MCQNKKDAIHFIELRLLIEKHYKNLSGFPTFRLKTEPPYMQKQAFTSEQRFAR